jgi:hypothetical protein
MVLTKFAFMGFSLSRAKQLGIHGSVEQFEAFSHFWRVLGNFLGIEDRFNICAESLSGTLSRIEAVISLIVAPSLNSAGSDFYQYSEAIFAGIWCIHPEIDFKSTLLFTKMLSGIEHENLKLGLYTKLRFLLNTIIYGKFMKFAVIRWIMNKFHNYVEILTEFFPISVIYKF